MFEAKKSRVYTTILSCTACALLAACGTAMMGPPRIVAEGAKWEEVSRAGLFTAEGVVAARDGMIYATDITRPEAIKHNNPGGTIYRYDPSTGVTTKFMEPSGMANGLHVDRNGDLIIAQEADGGGRAILRRNLTSGATTVLANSYQGKRLTGPNDVTSDARGRIYFTDAATSATKPSSCPTRYTGSIRTERSRSSRPTFSVLTASRSHRMGGDYTWQPRISRYSHRIH